MLFRALNESDIENFDNAYYLLCNFFRSDYKNDKTLKIIMNEIYYKNMGLALDRIIGHISGLNITHSCFISTSKNLNFVLEEYSIPQNGKYNIDFARKPVIVIINEQEIPPLAYTRNISGHQNISSYFGKYVDLANNNLNKYIESGFIKPLYMNEDSYFYNTLDSLNMEGKTCNVSGFNNFAYKAEEVLFFHGIDGKNIYTVLTPLMQDILYIYTKGKNNKQIEVMLPNILNTYKNVEKNIKNNVYLFSSTELNIISFLYTKKSNGFYHALIELMPYLYDKFIPSIELYDFLKEIKRNILRKITREQNIPLLDDEIFVSDLEHDKKNTLPNYRKINISNKHDIIYTTDEDNNLIRKTLTRHNKKDE